VGSQGTVCIINAVERASGARRGPKAAKSGDCI
jgi:hypothetical protein